MEKPDSRMSDRRSSTGDSALRPAASSTLAVYSQTELQASSRREGTRPPTSSTSSQSGTQPEWDTNRLSFYGSRATTSSDIDDLNLEPNEIWPPSDSEDDSGGDGKGGTTLKRTTTGKSSSTARKIKAILQKFGRSYNKRYDFLPNDAQEKDRNTLQHNIILEMLNGRLHLAPVDNARRVLDLGCGPGDWPLEFARRNPNTLVLGVDIDPIKPPFKLSNCRFQVADFNQEWSYDVKFDFIHLRHIGGLPKKHVVTSIYENLSPGGWAEFTEWVVSIQSTRNTFIETSFYKWLIHWKEGLNKIGQTVYYPLQYKRLLMEVGFKNVTERKYAVPVNPWPPGKQLQRIGSMMLLNINTIIEPMSMPIFTGILGWSPDAVESLLAEVRKELSDVDSMHAYMTLHTVYAQKPRGEHSSGSSIRSSERG
ncbi:S-adenosyl-L-methionine-dependent methyltransferase [Ustulina deusta]|nr:S-adenosyl-L-methionine-dependent methyltransferase [Ustulina deusta]KAI3343757.1 S-adenosyl-L-methionine-dependent methyltransferase [Ustulina deusta]